MDDWITDEHRADWFRDAADDSGHDAASIERDYESEYARIKREMDGLDFLDALYDYKDVLLTLVRNCDTASAALVLTEALHARCERDADISIFGKPLGKK